jgi:hypothetical protein
MENRKFFKIKDKLKIAWNKKKFWNVTLPKNKLLSKYNNKTNTKTVIYVGLQ